MKAFIDKITDASGGLRKGLALAQGLPEGFVERFSYSGEALPKGIRLFEKANAGARPAPGQRPATTQNYHDRVTDPSGGLLRIFGRRA
jgi:hypothetical protein